MSTEHYDPITGADARSQFGAQLNDIKRRLVEMGSLVTENLRRAGAAMSEANLDLLPLIYETDGIVDERYLELEREIFETLARQQPVARDLRFLVSATRIIYEQERSGDLVVNCANMLKREGGFPEIPTIQSLLIQAVDASARVFSMSVDAIADMDQEAGTTIDKADDEVDDLISRYYTEIGRNAEEMGLETAIALTRVGRFLERIADHSVNIGENVTYIVTAEMPMPEHHHITPSDQP